MTFPEGRDYRVEGNDTSGYIGVSPEYMTYANETEKPLLTSEEEWDYTNNLDHLEGNVDEESDEIEEDDETKEVEKSEETDETKPNPVVASPVITSVVQ